MPTVLTEQDLGVQMADPGRAPVVLRSTQNNKLSAFGFHRATTDRVCPRSARHRDISDTNTQFEIFRTAKSPRKSSVWFRFSAIGYFVCTIFLTRRAAAHAPPSFFAPLCYYMAREIKRPRNAQGRVTQLALRRTWHASILPRLGAHTPFASRRRIARASRRIQGRVVYRDRAGGGF